MDAAQEGGPASPGRRADSPLRRRGRWLPAPPMWLEGRLGAEYSNLRRDPVFRGVGVPFGSGRPVLLIPGFMAGDETLQVLQHWLERLGYRPDVGGIVFNVRSSDLVVAALATRA